MKGITVAGILAVAAGLSLFGTALVSAGEVETPRAAPTGQAAPSAEVEDLSASAAAGGLDFSVQGLGGETVRLSDFRGKTVVLNFWAPWCPPCRAEIPAFSAFAKANPDVVVIGMGVDAGGSTQAADATGKRMGISYPVFPADRKIMSTFQVSGLPTTLVLNGSGEVVATHTGAMSEAQLRRAVESARK